MSHALVVGVSGKINHGKDVVAETLQELFGFRIVRFSDALKQEVLDRLRLTLKEIVYERVSPDNTGPNAVPEPMRWLRNGRDKDEDWWTRRLRWELWERKQPIVRRLLQEYGSDVRRTDDPNYWVKKWRETVRAIDRDSPLHAPARLVTPDTRFVNEAEYIRMERGVLVRVDRPGVTDHGDHQSETSLDGWDDWDVVIQNTGTIHDLRTKTIEWYERLSLTRLADPSVGPVLAESLR